MELILWRHADAHDGIPDFYRPLSGKGKQQASEAATWLLPQLDPTARLWVSPSLRTQQTADTLNLSYQIIDDLYFKQHPEKIIQLTGWPDEPGQTLIVGHQPTLGQIILRLTQQANIEVKKNSIWWISSNYSSPAIIQNVYPGKLKPV
ncbi:MAG: histidine phosphatase family protein [Proteobacteria bacterium]|nr:histidine phosphatase family protein [Pseudomonadota bacterium]MDE3207322.1 histidine phosphatase family protein [Pseudomonadota bacterium]